MDPMFERFARRKFLSALAAILVAGCEALPNAGPVGLAITDEQLANEPSKQFVVVQLDPAVLNIVGQYRPPILSTYFSVGGEPELVIDQGDTLLINVWEAGADGLFSTTDAKTTQVTSVVDQQGRIFVPYVGPVQVAGRSVEGVRQSIERALVDRAIQPQVQVLVAESIANTATVVGDVNTPGRFPISPAGTRLLDVIALSGGSRFPTYETRVTLKRGTVVASANLEHVFDNPRENVLLFPGDNVLVSHVPRTFTAFGAVGQQQEIPFNDRRVTLAEALARAGGLNDNLADADSVFVFRFELDELARQVSERADVVPHGNGIFVPTIYRLNLRQPEGFFYAQLFEMRDEDLVYVANNPTAEFGKFLQIITPLLNLAGRTQTFVD